MTAANANAKLVRMTYSSAGVDRLQRRVIRKQIHHVLRMESRKYPRGNPIELPFGAVYPISNKFKEFLDLQIEGIGTKTLLAELHPEAYSTIGIDGVAMVVNDIIRSGAKPLLLSDAIHIAESRKDLIQSLLSGIRRGAEISNCILASGETGDVSEVLHKTLLNNESRPFDIIVSCLGVVNRENLVMGKIDPTDQIVGIESSGIHSNGLTLARRILLKEWGGKYDLFDQPEGLDRPLIEELLKPTRIYSKPVLEAVHKIGLKAAIHITGDGFSKFHRIIDYQRQLKGGKKVGIEFDGLGKGSSSTFDIFEIIQKTSKEIGKSISQREMYQTFNMGFGFAVVVEKQNVDQLVDLFNKYHRSKRIGQVTKSGDVRILRSEKVQRTMTL